MTAQEQAQEQEQSAKLHCAAQHIRGCLGGCFRGGYIIRAYITGQRQKLNLDDIYYKNLAG